MSSRKSIRATANDLDRSAESLAWLAVQAMQTGRPHETLLRMAAERRATAYELHATADIITPLQEERWEKERKAGYIA